LAPAYSVPISEALSAATTILVGDSGAPLLSLLVVAVELLP
jgi:hypothetical protein